MIPLDLKRLLDHEVELFGFDLEGIWKVIQAFVRYCDEFSTMQGDVQIASEDELKQLRDDSPYTFFIAREYPGKSRELAITALLRQPRILKHTLRRTWVAWQSLHGEVSLEDLLLYSTIRVVDSDAISFIRDQWHTLVSDPSRQGAREAKTELSNLWNAKVRRCSESQKEHLWMLTQFLFPSSNDYPTYHKVQGARKERYWSRIANGRMEPNAIPDQMILKDVKEWKKSHDASGIIHRLMQDTKYISVFEDLLEGHSPASVHLTGQNILELASLLFEEMRKRYGIHANQESCPGFISLWRLQDRGGRRFTDYETWLWTEIEKSLQVSLHLVADIEYYWGTSKYSPLDNEGEIRIRRRVEDWTRTNANAEFLGSMLPLEVPYYLLYSLVFGPPSESQKPEPDWPNLRWIAEILLDVLAHDRSRMIRQTIGFFTGSGHRTRQPLLEEHDGEEPERVLETVYHIKRDCICGLFESIPLRRQFAQAILEPAEDEESWSDSDREMISQVRAELLEWQKEGMQ